MPKSDTGLTKQGASWGRRILLVEADQDPRPVTVLAVGAYPGDVEGGCAGALLAHRNRGDRVVTLPFFPDGRTRSPQMSHRRLPPETEDP